MSGVLPFDDDELRLRDAALRRLARRLSWSDADAEDAVQETWLKSLIAPPRDSQRRSAWLRVVVLHALGKIQRRRRNDRERLRRRAGPSEGPSPLDDLERETSGARVLDWLHRLDEPYREVLRLRYLEDLSTAQIAGLLGRREGTVRVQLKRGLDILRVRAGERAVQGHPRGAPRGERRFAALSLSWLRMRWATRGFALASGIAALLVALTIAPSILTRSTPEPVSSARTSKGDTVLAALALEEVRIPAASRVAAARPLLPASVTVPPVSAAAEAGSFVEGACYTDMREPVPAAEIWGAPHGGLGAGELLGHADAEGRYRMRVPPGIDWLWADEVIRAGDGSEQQRSGSLRVRLAGCRNAAPVELFFPQRLSIDLSGIVVDSTGAPVAGARVGTGDAWSDAPLLDERWQIHPHPSSATTDEHGEFRLRLFRQAHQDLCVVKPGFPPASQRVPAGVSRVSIPLPRAVVLGGRLVAPDRGALSGAEVLLELAEPLPQLRARTDEAGRFRFEQVPPGDFRLLAFPHEAGLSLIHEGRCAEGEARDLGDLEATGLHSLRGAAFEDGQPVPGWRVVLQEEALGRGVGEQTRTSTGADGSFEFKACPEGSYRVWLLEPGATDGPARTSLGGLRPGCAGVRLEAAKSCARIQGRVEESLRSTIQVYLDGALLPRTALLRSGPDGSFERSLPAGSYELTAVSRALGRWSVASLELAPGETRLVDCRAPPTGSLLIRLHPAPGFERSALRHLQGQLIGSGFSTTFQANGIAEQIDVEQGTIHFPTLPSGDYVALLYTGVAGSMGAEYRSARIEAGRQTELDVHFEPGHRVRVRCRSERALLDGEQLSCVIASKHGEVRFPASATVPGSLDAMLLFRKLLAAGSYSLRVESDRGLTGSLEFSVPGSERYELALR